MDATPRPDTSGEQRVRYGDYQADYQAAKGSAAIVWKGHHAETGRAVAIKVVASVAPEPTTQTTPPNRLCERLDREYKKLVQYHHPNLIEVLAFGRDPDCSWLVLPWVSGGTLHRRITAAVSPLTTSECAMMGMQIGLALAALHARGIVHRDLKPANVLIDGDDPYHVIVADLGIAREHEDTLLTLDGNTVGTLGYMSPEQIHGKPLDGRSDVYSLGAILYFAMTRHPMFDGELYAVLNAHLYAEPPPIRTYNSQVPALLVHIINKCLRKDPDDRYPSARAVVDALSQFVGQGELALCGTASLTILEPFVAYAAAQAEH